MKNETESISIQLSYKSHNRNFKNHKKINQRKIKTIQYSYKKQFIILIYLKDTIENKVISIINF